MQLIPLTALPNQTINIVLGSQNCTIKVFQKSTGVFIDLLVNDAPIAQGVLVLDRVKLIRVDQTVFIGDLAFYDSQGLEPPYYTGFGTRWNLLYIESSEI